MKYEHRRNKQAYKNDRVTECSITVRKYDKTVLVLIGGVSWDTQLYWIR